MRSVLGDAAHAVGGGGLEAAAVVIWYPPRTLIVTGSRRWPAPHVITAVLGWYAPELVVHGDADGADAMAERWAKRALIAHIGLPAKWRKDGKLDRSAGYARNAGMLCMFPGVLVLAFPHPTLKSNGTRHCMKLAEGRGHPLRVYDLEGKLTHRSGPVLPQWKDEEWKD